MLVAIVVVVFVAIVVVVAAIVLAVVTANADDASVWQGAWSQVLRGHAAALPEQQADVCLRCKDKE